MVEAGVVTTLKKPLDWYLNEQVVKGCEINAGEWD